MHALRCQVCVRYLDTVITGMDIGGRGLNMAQRNPMIDTKEHYHFLNLDIHIQPPNLEP
jgi:hypothetical protein